MSFIVIIIRPNLDYLTLFTVVKVRLRPGEVRTLLHTCWFTSGNTWRVMYGAARCQILHMKIFMNHTQTETQTQTETEKVKYLLTLQPTCGLLLLLTRHTQTPHVSHVKVSSGCPSAANVASKNTFKTAFQQRREVFLFVSFPCLSCRCFIQRGDHILSCFQPTFLGKKS